MNSKVIVKGAITLLSKRFAGPFWFRRKQLAKTQWWSQQELGSLQLKLLKRLVSHAYNTVPYYRKLMDERSIKVESIKDIEDIKQFPILTKKDVLQAGENIVSTKYPKWLMHKARTGGTTGTPMEIYRTLSSIGNEHAFVRRQWDWAEISFSDNCAWIIAGRRIASPDSTNSNLYVYDPFMKELTLSIYHLTPQTAKEYVEAINRYNVKAIVGIASAIYFLAQICSQKNLTVKLKAVLTTSENLLSPMREIISSTFGCKVFDFYGAAERVCYIYTCEKGTYHIIPEYGLTELIPAGYSRNRDYRIIATGFWNLGMPLIRYDTEDIVTGSDRVDCNCGRSFPIVESIGGRYSDVIKTRSGRQYGSTIAARILKEANNILESQIVQDSLDHIYVRYVPTEKFSEKDSVELKQLLSHFLPSELKVDLQCVEAIPRTSSGKLKLIVTQI
jgi:phenylacetate-CoA ligase